MMKQPTVVLMRHGERADEVASSVASVRRRRHGPKTTEDHRNNLDPALTEEGHRQAREAWEALLPTLRGRRVMVAVSPTQRTIGTALNVGAVAAQSDVHFVLPGHSKPTAGHVPVLVMNGLSDSAAYVTRRGGAWRAASQGLLDCGAIRANDGSRQSPFSQRLSSIIFSNQTAMVNMPLGNDVPKIQFWKETFRNSSYSPMSESFALNRIQGRKNADVRLQTQYPMAPTAQEDTFVSTIHRAALLAADADCDVVVLVTHRESIRSLAYDGCRFDPYRRADRLSAPYCCLASFEATVRRDGVRWWFHGCSAYQNFGLSNLPPPNAALSDDGQAWKLHNPEIGTFHGPIQSDVAIVGVRTARAEERNPTGSEQQQVVLLLKSGRRNIQHYLRKLRKSCSVALIQKSVDGGDNSMWEMNPFHQPVLPAPPHMLYLTRRVEHQVRN